MIIHLLCAYIEDDNMGMIKEGFSHDIVDMIG